MRTTLTLEPDVAMRLQERVASTGASIKDVVNQALRIGLAQQPEAVRPRFKVKAHPLGLRPGIDPTKLNQLLDEMDIEEFAARTKR
jgi:hypothetical protein